MLGSVLGTGNIMVSKINKNLISHGEHSSGEGQET